MQVYQHTTLTTQVRTGGSSRLGGLAVWAMLLFSAFCQDAFAQGITVTDAVISIPHGTILSLDGGITLQDNGGIANDGTIELKGDWTNNGDGLLESGKGTVVFNGQDQVIGGEHASSFAVLVLDSKETIELASDIAVTGKLEIRNCWVLAHDFSIQVPMPSLLDYSLGLAHVIRGDGPNPLPSACRITASGSTGNSNLLNTRGAHSSAPLGSAPRLRIDRAGGAQAPGISLPIATDQPAVLTLQAKHQPSISNGASAAIHTMYHAGGLDAFDSSNAGLSTSGQLVQFHTIESRGSLNPVPASAAFLFHIVRNGHS